METVGLDSFAPESERCILNEPGKRLGDSISSGWTSAVMGVVEGRGCSDAFDSTITPDQTLVIVTRGSMNLEVFEKGAWRSALRKTGSIGLTPANHYNRLRWTALGAPSAFETTHIFLPQTLIARATDELRRFGESVKGEPANATAIDDPVITNLALSLVAAHRSQDGDLLASSIVQAIAIRMVSMENGWLEADRPHYGGSLRGSRLKRLLEFMRANCTKELSLERLAAEAGLSRFQLIRAFRNSVGTAPHRYLVNLRLDAAAKLLRDPDRTVAGIAVTCGFSSAAHLSKAFRRRFARTPTEFRQRSRTPEPTL